MKVRILLSAAAIALGSATIAVAAENRYDALARLPFVENRPIAATAKTLQEDLLMAGSFPVSNPVAT